MTIDVGDAVELILVWNSRHGKAVGNFAGKVVALCDGDFAEVQIEDLTSVKPSNSQLGGPTNVQQVIDEVEAFRKSTISVAVAVTRGAPMYVANPLDVNRT